MTTLDGTVTLKEVNGVPLGIRKDLHFDMTRSFKETFNENGSVSECRFGLTHGPLKRGFEFGLFADNPHSSTASTHGCFDDDYMKNS
jgi:hypothetical protein